MGKSIGAGQALVATVRCSTIELRPPKSGGQHTSAAARKRAVEALDFILSLGSDVDRVRRRMIAQQAAARLNAKRSARGAA
jgi:hypothetical protein